MSYIHQDYYLIPNSPHPFADDTERFLEYCVSEKILKNPHKMVLIKNKKVSNLYHIYFPDYHRHFIMDITVRHMSGNNPGKIFITYNAKNAKELISIYKTLLFQLKTRFKNVNSTYFMRKNYLDLIEGLKPETEDSTVSDFGSNYLINEFICKDILSYLQ
jgi:hypothetical protein